MADVFISYSRKDIQFVQRLHDAIAAHRHNSWVDWKDIAPTAEWLQEILAAIEGADAFLFILSEDSIKSEICCRELDHAVRHNKRLIPVICRDMSSKEVPEPLSKLNWIFLRESDDFDGGLQKLLEAVDIDLDWVNAHTRLLTRAVEWERRDQDRSLLLRGNDLKEAESWLAESGEKEPKPTELQGQYIIESRKKATTMLRWSLGGVTAGLLVAIALAIIAFIQYRMAEERGRIAKSRQLAAQSEYYRNFEIDLSLLLSVEAYKVKPTVQAKDALLGALQKSPKLLRFIEAPKGLRQDVGFRRDDLYNVVFSPDGKWLARGNPDGTIKIWDVDKGQLSGPPLKGHQEAVICVVFNPDSKILASAGHDKTIILWDVENHKSLEPRLKGHSETVTSMAFSPDGEILASASLDRTILLWDVASRRPLRAPLFKQKEEVVSVAFSPDGKYMASASWQYSDYNRSGDTILWYVDKQKYRGSPPLIGQEKKPVHNVAFSPNSKILAGATTNGIMLWDVNTRKALRPPRYRGLRSVVLNPSTGRPVNLPEDSMDPISNFPKGAALIGHKYDVLSVAFSPNGKTLASGGTDNTIILWDVERRIALDSPLNGHQKMVTSVAFSPDAKLLASTSQDRSVILWDLEDRHSLVHFLKGQRGRVLSVAFSPDGKLMASASENNTIILWDMKNRQPLGSLLNGDENSVKSVAFSPDSKLLASGGSSTTITLWDVKKRQSLGAPLKGHEETVLSIAFSPDGRLLASGSADGGLKLWDMESRQSLDHSYNGSLGWVKSVAFSPDSKLLALASGRNTLVILDIKTRQLLVNTSKGGTCVAFSPDGKLLALGGNDNTVTLWDLETHQPLDPPMKGSVSGVESIAFSPDGKFLASVNEDNIITLWDIKARQPLEHTLEGSNCVAFSPDGKLLATGGILKLWDVGLSSWIKRACSISNRNLTEEEWRRFMDYDVPFRRTCADLPVLRE